jgi:type VI secretion system protein ImpB
MKHIAHSLLPIPHAIARRRERRPASHPRFRSGRIGPFSSTRKVSMSAKSSQKFIARNRAPRVQIEYDVEIYGGEKKIELPFVMGVLADLSGNPVEALPGVDERKFLEIDIDNFDERMKAIAPRVAFSVPNTLTGEGHVMVDLTFESMDDFSPAAVANKVDALKQLLDARLQLSNLQTYMDGKAGAEDLVRQLLADPVLLKALASAPKPVTLNS